MGAGGNKISVPVSSGVSGTPTGYTINGKGWGHGVGMSQMGAIGMADAGKNYTEIIQHYFTGVQITQLN
jgi:stage II sporulation protein D